MRLRTRGIVYHPEQTPGLSDRHAFSLEGVPAADFVEALLDELVRGQEVGLPDPQGDCSLRVRRASSGYQTRHVCHGWFSDPWHEATRPEAAAWLLPGAECMVRGKSALGWLYWHPEEG